MKCENPIGLRDKFRQHEPYEKRQLRDLERILHLSSNFKAAGTPMRSSVEVRNVKADFLYGVPPDVSLQHKGVGELLNNHSSSYVLMDPWHGYYDYICPCRKCFSCLKARAFEWFLRCECERRLFEQSCVVTLTYADRPAVFELDGKKYVAQSSRAGEHDYSHIQKFLKRLRKFVGSRISFFCAAHIGENGTRRQHWHIILFGYMPTDLRPFKKYYLSSELARLWTYGNILVDRVTFRSINYVVRYLVDKSTDDVFYRMSLKPAIGDTYMQSPDNLFKETLSLSGKIFPMPRRQIKALEKVDTVLAEKVRQRSAVYDVDVTMQQLLDNVVANAKALEEHRLRKIIKK